MTEIQKIVQLFDELQQGDCWIGFNMKDVLTGVDPKTAVYKPDPGGNSIWQLVNHLAFWRNTVMLRLQGKDAYPEGADFYLPEIHDEAAWKNTLQEFTDTYTNFRKAILAFDETQLNGPSPKPEQTNYKLLMGCLQHDCYHMGQMVLLKKSSV